MYTYIYIYIYIYTYINIYTYTYIHMSGMLILLISGFIHMYMPCMFILQIVFTVTFYIG